jgi:transposase
LSRKSKCTTAVIDAIASALSEGLTFESACECGGVSKQTGYDWLKRGEAGEEPFLTFSDAVKKAQALGEYALVRTIQDATVKHWQAAAWLLERRFPERWGRRVSTIELSSADKEDLALARKNREMSADERAQRLEELLKKRQQFFDINDEYLHRNVALIR